MGRQEGKGWGGGVGGNGGTGAGRGGGAGVAVGVRRLWEDSRTLEKGVFSETPLKTQSKLTRR